MHRFDLQVFNMSILSTMQTSCSASRVQPRTSGRIISDGCRDYLVGINLGYKTEILTNRNGKPLRFASLAAAKHRLRRANVTEIELSVRVAGDEACAGTPLRDSGFTAVDLTRGRD